MKAEDKSCNNCGHHYQNGQRCNARPCRSGDKWKAIAPKPEQPREQEIAETILVDDGSVMGRTMKLSDYNAQFKKIEPKPDTLQAEPSASLILGKHIIAYNSQQNDSSKRINLSVAKSQVFEEAMEEYAKENLREEYIQFLDWNKYSTSKRIVELINFDEYLKQKQFK
jgi:hypothetical protein